MSCEFLTTAPSHSFGTKCQGWKWKQLKHSCVCVWLGLTKIKDHHVEDSVHKSMPVPNKRQKNRQWIKHPAIPQYFINLYHYPWRNFNQFIRWWSCTIKDIISVNLVHLPCKNRWLKSTPQRHCLGILLPPFRVLGCFEIAMKFFPRGMNTPSSRIDCYKMI